ncbi:hypothetical protein Landi51_04764 [Colletotrichum acutatum]
MAGVSFGGVQVAVEQSDYGATGGLQPASAPGRGRDLWGISASPTPRDARPWRRREARLSDERSPNQVDSVPSIKLSTLRWRRRMIAGPFGVRRRYRILHEYGMRDAVRTNPWRDMV